MTTDQLPLFALIVGTLGVLATWMTYAGIKKQPAGSEDMQRLAGQIHTGALAFLRREYTVLLPFLAIVAVLLGLAISLKTGMAYVAGGLCSIATGWISSMSRFTLSPGITISTPLGSVHTPVTSVVRK